MIVWAKWIDNMMTMKKSLASQHFFFKKFNALVDVLSSLRSICFSTRVNSLSRRLGKQSSNSLLGVVRPCISTTSFLDVVNEVLACSLRNGGHPGGQVSKCAVGPPWLVNSVSCLVRVEWVTKGQEVEHAPALCWNADGLRFCREGGGAEVERSIRWGPPWLERDRFSVRMAPVVRVNVLAEEWRCADEFISGRAEERGDGKEGTKVHPGGMMTHLGSYLLAVCSLYVLSPNGITQPAPWWQHQTKQEHSPFDGILIDSFSFERFKAFFTWPIKFTD